MTDDQLDARLRAAGERWRSDHVATATVTDPDAGADPIDHEPPPPLAHRRRWGLFASAAAVAAALVVGGAFLVHGSHDPTPSGDTVALEGHVWLLQDPQRGSNSTASLYIDHNGNLVADDECRLIGASLAIDGNRITAGDPVVRFKGCTDQYSIGYYDDGTAVLAGSSTYTITDDMLTLSTEHKDLHFTLAPASTPVPTLDFPTVVGQDWTLVSGKDADGNAIPVAGDATFHLADDGTLSGSDGCNSAGGKVTVDGPTLVFGQVGGTEMYCGGDRGATEKAVMAMYSGRVAAGVSAGQLTLHKGGASLVYRWVPSDKSATDPTALQGIAWHNGDSTLRVADGKLSYNDGCTPSTATIDVLPGVFELGQLQGASTSCSGGTGNAGGGTAFDPGEYLWSVRDGILTIGTGFAQASALVFTSSTQPPPTTLKLVGPTWTLSSIHAGDGRYRNGAPPAEVSSLKLTGDTFAVKHTCYAQQGDTSVDASTVTFTQGAVTDPHPCPFQLGRDAAAQLVDQILDGADTWSVDGSTLTITSTDKGSLTFFTGTDTTTNEPLDGTRWQLETAIDNGKEYASTEAKVFFDQGQVQAYDGLNTISGSASTDGASLTFGDLASTAIGTTTDDPVRDVVDAVFAKGEVGYDIVGDALTITRNLQQLVFRVVTTTNPDGARRHRIAGKWTLTTIEHGTGPDGSASPADDAGRVHGRRLGSQPRHRRCRIRAVRRLQYQLR